MLVEEAVVAVLVAAVVVGEDGEGVREGRVAVGGRALLVRRGAEVGGGDVGVVVAAALGFRD